MNGALVWAASMLAICGAQFIIQQETCNDLCRVEIALNKTIYQDCRNQLWEHRKLINLTITPCDKDPCIYRKDATYEISFYAVATLVTNFRQESQHLTKGTAVGHVEEIEDSAAIAVISEDASPTQNKTITSSELDIDPSLPAPQRRQLRDLLAEFSECFSTSSKHTEDLRAFGEEVPFNFTNPDVDMPLRVKRNETFKITARLCRKFYPYDFTLKIFVGTWQYAFGCADAHVHVTREWKKCLNYDNSEQPTSPQKPRSRAEL
ncbi:uncharacterized protein ISCGN_030560 [Ixodes scapularis]